MDTPGCGSGEFFLDEERQRVEVEGGLDSPTVLRLGTSARNYFPVPTSS